MGIGNQQIFADSITASDTMTLNTGSGFVKGVSSVVASVQTGVVSATQTNLLNYTPRPEAHIYRIMVVIDNTSSTNTGTNTVTVTYANSNGTSITYTVPLAKVAGSFGTTSTGVSTSFCGVLTISIDNSGTAITLTSTVSGTTSATIGVVLERLT